MTGGAFTRLTASTDSRIAITRTAAPMAWALVVTWVADAFGVDLADWIAMLDGDGGVDAESAASLATGVIFVALYLVGRWRPGVVERVLLGVQVKDTSYTTTGD